MHLHTFWQFSFTEVQLCLLTDTLLSLLFLLFHHLIKDKHRTGSWNWICFELRLLEIIWQVLLRIYLLLKFVPFVEAERFLVRLGQCQWVFLHFESTHLIRLLNRFIPWDQNLGWDRLATELMFDNIFFLISLLSNHLFNLTLPNCLSASLFPQIKIERLWNCNAILALASLRSLSIVTSC